MKQDYYGQVFPPRGPKITPAELPAGPQIRDANDQAQAIHKGLDMIRLTAEQRTRLGNAASSPEEAELSRLLADLSDTCPGLLPLLGHEDGVMRAGYDMERALWAYRQANLNVLKVNRGGLIISAADLTDQNDRAEVACHRLAGSQSISPERRAVIGNAVQVLDRLPSLQQDPKQRFTQQQQRMRSRQEASLPPSRTRQQQVYTLAKQAATPLPDPAAGTEGDAGHDAAAKASR